MAAPLGRQLENATCSFICKCNVAVPLTLRSNSTALDGCFFCLGGGGGFGYKPDSPVPQWREKGMESE